MSEATTPTTVTVPREAWFRWLFYAAHLVLPAAALWLSIAHIWWYVNLSWQLLIVATAGLLPFLLPLAAVYIGKLGPFEPRAYSSTIPATPPMEARSESQVQAPSPQPAMPSGPQKKAYRIIRKSNLLPEVAVEEEKILRTLWFYQHEYQKSGRSDAWGFGVGQHSPNYSEFVRGFNWLMQRGFVLQDDRGLIYLTNSGREYCSKNSEKILTAGPAWSNFEPIG